MKIVIMGFIMILYFCVLAVAVADYVLKALALFTLAKRRGIKNPWHAWIPVASDWIVGSLADEIDLQRVMNRSWGKTLFVMSISLTGSVILGYALLVFVTVKAAFVLYMQEVLVAFAVLVYVLIFIISVVAMAYSLLKAICIYKIFESTVPEKTVKYLVLYFIVPLAGAICLNKCKNEGYPEAVTDEVCKHQDECSQL